MENGKKFGFEVYTLNPETKDTGWDIKFVDVIAETKAEAKEILKTWDLFDCIILFNYEVHQTSAPYYKNGVIIEKEPRHNTFVRIIK